MRTPRPPRSRLHFPALAAIVAALTLLASSCWPFDDDDEPPPEDTTTTSQTTTSSSTPSTSEPEEPTDVGAVAYFFLAPSEGEGSAGGPFLVPVFRPDAGADVESALDALVAGVPPDDDPAASPALSSAVPEGTTLLGVDVEGGVATVDLSGEFATGGGSFSVLGRLGQVTYTATRFDAVDAVRFALDGEPIDVFPTGEGVVLDEPVGRDFFDGAGLLPRLFVDHPAWRQPVPPTFELRGIATDIFEGDFSWEVSVGGEDVLAEGSALAEGAFGPQPFSTTVDVPDVDERQELVLTVFDRGARAGETQFLRAYPIVVDPALANGDDGDGAEPEPVVATFQTADGTFRAVLRDPSTIEAARQAAAGDGDAGIPNGRILAGDGAVNTGHDWHLEDVRFAEVTIEVCDGTAAFVDANLDQFLELGRFCPWTAEVTDVEPYAATGQG